MKCIMTEKDEANQKHEWHRRTAASKLQMDSRGGNWCMFGILRGFGLFTIILIYSRNAVYIGTVNPCIKSFHFKLSYCYFAIIIEEKFQLTSLQNIYVRMLFAPQNFGFPTFFPTTHTWLSLSWMASGHLGCLTMPHGFIQSSNLLAHTSLQQYEIFFAFCDICT